MKKQLFLWGALTLVACGPKEPRVLTPEDRLNQQLGIAESQKEQQAENTSRFDESATVDEEAAEFDEDAANHEMRRASNNALDCPNTFEKDQLAGYSPGKATVTMTFVNDGSVKDVSVNPYGDTPVGDCVVRAMSTVRVEQFRGTEVIKTWELDMPAPAKKK